jgi:hypothetical protein
VRYALASGFAVGAHGYGRAHQRSY